MFIKRNVKVKSKELKLIAFGNWELELGWGLHQTFEQH